MPAMLSAIWTLVGTGGRHKAMLSIDMADGPDGLHVCSKTGRLLRPNSSQQHCSSHHQPGALHSCMAALFLIPSAAACSGSISPVGNSGRPRRPFVYTISHTRYAAATLACCYCHESYTAPGAASADVSTTQPSCVQPSFCHACLAAPHAASAQALMIGPYGSATIDKSTYSLHPLRAFCASC